MLVFNLVGKVKKNAHAHVLFPRFYASLTSFLGFKFHIPVKSKDY